MDLSNVEWPSTWSACDNRVLEDELKREVASDHSIYGEEIQVVAQRGDRDDVLYYLTSKNAFALVHLTWSSKTENPPWPSTKIYQTFNEFAAENFDEQE